MDLTLLNPDIHSVSLYEKINRQEECVSYDSKIIYMVSGSVSAVVAGEKLGHIDPGNLLYIPAGVPYLLKGKYLRALVIGFDLVASEKEWEKRGPTPVTEFDRTALDGIYFPAPFDKKILLPDVESERDGLLKMESIFTSGEGAYRAKISAMLKLLLLKIAESADENSLPARMVEELDAYIRDNRAEEISNTEIGAIFGYHPFYVSQMIKEKKGQTLRQYIISYRLRSAKRQLELTDKTTAEIAEDNGFTDASYFAKTFKSAFGMTPKEYRNQFKDEFI